MLMQEKIFRCFLNLPERLLLFHDMENIAEFIMHSLCNENCLNLSKAAYFIDNHDFNCLKGITGFDKNNMLDKNINDNIWENIDLFNNHMQKCLFNQKVRNINIKSKNIHNNKNNNIEIIADLAKELDINKPAYYSWKIKHDNHAIFLFEDLNNIIDQDILKGVCLLGFCPIF